MKPTAMTPNNEAAMTSDDAEEYFADLNVDELDPTPEVELVPGPARKPPARTLTVSQRAGAERLRLLGRAFFAQEFRRLSIQPRLFPLLIGPTGAGKTFLVRESAESLGASYLRITYGEWMPLGVSRAGGPTAFALLEAVEGASRLLFHVDELDKCRDLFSTEWGRSVATDLWNVLDGLLPFEAYLRSKRRPVEECAALRRLVAERLWIVGSGTWQDVFAQQDRPSLGFGAAEPPPEADDKALFERITRARLIPEELLARFASDPVFLRYPANAAETQVLLEGSGLAAMARAAGVPLDPSELDLRHAGMRALETMATRVLLAMERDRELRSMAEPVCAKSAMPKVESEAGGPSAPGSSVAGDGECKLQAPVVGNRPDLRRSPASYRLIVDAGGADIDAVSMQVRSLEWPGSEEQDGASAAKTPKVQVRIVHEERSSAARLHFATAVPDAHETLGWMVLGELRAPDDWVRLQRRFGCFQGGWGCRVVQDPAYIGFDAWAKACGFDLRGSFRVDSIRPWAGSVAAELAHPRPLGLAEEYYEAVQWCARDLGRRYVDEKLFREEVWSWFSPAMRTAAEQREQRNRKLFAWSHPRGRLGPSLGSLRGSDWWRQLRADVVRGVAIAALSAANEATDTPLEQRGESLFVRLEQLWNWADGLASGLPSPDFPLEIATPSRLPAVPGLPTDGNMREWAELTEKERRQVGMAFARQLRIAGPNLPSSGSSSAAQTAKESLR